MFAIIPFTENNLFMKVQRGKERPFHIRVSCDAKNDRFSISLHKHINYITKFFRGMPTLQILKGTRQHQSVTLIES